MFHIKLFFTFLDAKLSAYLTVRILGTFTTDLLVHCPPVWSYLAKWSQCSPPGGGADEIPVYLGDVALSYNLRSVHVPKMQIWSVLLIPMLRSVLMYRIFELNAKYSFDSASMWSKEFISINFLEVLFSSYLSGQAIKDSFNNHLRRKLVIHHLGIISNLFLYNTGVIQLFLCLLEGYCLSYLVQFSIVLLEAIRNFDSLCYNVRKVIASSTQTQNMLIPSLYLMLCSIVHSVDACAVPMCRSRCPDRLVKACRCLVCSLIRFIKLWAKNCLIALVGVCAAEVQEFT